MYVAERLRSPIIVRQDWPADLLNRAERLRVHDERHNRLLFLSTTPMNDSQLEITELLKLCTRQTRQVSLPSPLDELREFKTFQMNFYDRLPRIFRGGITSMNDLGEYTSRLQVTADGDRLVIEAAAILSEMIYAGVIRREGELQPRSRLTIRELCRELFGSEESSIPAPSPTISKCEIPVFLGTTYYQPLSSATPTEIQICENLSRQMSDMNYIKLSM